MSSFVKAIDRFLNKKSIKSSSIDNNVDNNVDINTSRNINISRCNQLIVRDNQVLLNGSVIHNGKEGAHYTVIVKGNISGGVDCTTITVEGNIKGNVNSSALRTTGDITGDVNCTSLRCRDIGGSVDATSISRR